MKFVTAVKIYHQRNGSKYKVPRKNTPEYDAVRKIMLEGGPVPTKTKTKTKNINMDVKPAIIDKVVSEILEDIEISKASEMVKDILSKHMKEAEREVVDTFQGEGINDLLKMIPDSIASQKDINQVKQSAVDVSKGKFDADELFASFKNIKKAVNKIDSTIKKEQQKGSGLSQLGGGILDDIAKLINPILPILKSVAPMPLKIATDSIENLKRDFDIVKQAINKVGVSAKKQQGKGLMQLGNGDQSGGFIFTIPLIISGLIAGAQALAAGAAGAVGARLAKGVINLTEGKKF